MDGFELIVRGHFDGYVRGDVISDPAEMERILAGPHQYDVVRRKSDPGVAPAVPPVPTYVIGGDK